MAEYANLIGLGIVGVFVIGMGFWINWKLGAKRRAAAKSRKVTLKRASAVANRQHANGEMDDFEEEFLEAESNSLPDEDDDDGEFKDTNLFGLKRRKDGPDVYRDWD